MDVQACVRTRQIYLRFKPSYYSKKKNNYPYDPCSPNKKILLTFVAFMEMLLINNFLSVLGLPLLTDGVSNGVFCTPVNKNMNKLVHKVLQNKKISTNFHLLKQPTTDISRDMAAMQCCSLKHFMQPLGKRLKNIGELPFGIYSNTMSQAQNTRFYVTVL